MATTIHAAVAEVIRSANRPMTVDEILEGINAKNLYEFKTKSPRGVVAQAIRRRCEGGRVGTTPLFKDAGGRKYELI